MLKESTESKGFVEYTRYKMAAMDCEVAREAIEPLSNPRKARTVFARQVAREAFA